jgi:hypothetical protein
LTALNNNPPPSTSAAALTAVSVLSDNMSWKDATAEMTIVTASVSVSSAFVVFSIFVGGYLCLYLRKLGGAQKMMSSDWLDFSFLAARWMSPIFLLLLS